MKMQAQFRLGFAWLELLLALALLAILFQLFPSLWIGALWALDIRNWPRTVWFIANWVVVLGLVAARFGPALLNDWRVRHERRSSAQAKKQKQQQLKEQRETLQRMKEGQKRRLY